MYYVAIVVFSGYFSYLFLLQHRDVGSNPDQGITYAATGMSVVVC